MSRDDEIVEVVGTVSAPTPLWMIVPWQVFALFDLVRRYGPVAQDLTCQAVDALSDGEVVAEMEADSSGNGKVIALRNRATKTQSEVAK